jgi:tetratricopeptide (TPR) repeat protein
MRVAFCLPLILSVLPTNAFAQQVGDRVGEQIVVTTPNAALRSRNDTTGTVAAGTTLVVKHVEGDWFWVVHQSRAGVVKGWINRADVTASSRALDFFNEALGRNPTAGAYAGRAKIWREKGEFDRAIDDCNRAIFLDPAMADAYNTRALAWMKKGEVDRAIADWNEAIVTPAVIGRSRPDDPLALRNLAFCEKIENYGRWTHFKRDEFTPGEPVRLYTDMDNFASECNADKDWRTVLKSTIEIFNEKRKLVQSMRFAPNEDLSKNLRRDYYNSYEFTVPSACAPGPHTLKLTVEDQLSGKVATGTVNFTVK